jgi:uncharacterized tellurite resistance protein B-like protein
MPFPESVDPANPTRLDILELAFAVRVAQRICEADGVIAASELELLGRAFPTELLVRSGLLDADHRVTEAAVTHFRSALAELPEVLTTEEKLELVTLFHRASAADGAVHPNELRVLEEAAAMLLLPKRALLARLAELGQG